MIGSTVLGIGTDGWGTRVKERPVNVMCVSVLPYPGRESYLNQGCLRGEWRARLGRLGSSKNMDGSRHGWLGYLGICALVEETIGWMDLQSMNE